MLTVHAVIAEVPPDHRGGYTLERAEVRGSAVSYDDALGQARRLVPQGWRVIALRVDRNRPDADQS